MKTAEEIKAFINSEAGMKWQINTEEGVKCTVKGVDALEKAIEDAKAQLGDVVGAFVGGVMGRSAGVAAVEECAISTLGGKPARTPTADVSDTVRGTRGGALR